MHDCKEDIPDGGKSHLIEDSRVDSVAKILHEGGTIKETRGGDRVSHISKLEREQARTFIGSLKVLKVTTAEKKSSRVYLPGDQIQPLPKTPNQEEFYARQLWFYALCVVGVDPRKPTFYTWTEDKAGRGAREVDPDVKSRPNFFTSLHLKSKELLVKRPPSTRSSKMGVGGQKNIGTPPANQHLGTYSHAGSPANREHFAA
ncbi:hypothetical protein PR048_000515 [Dryococelus australis]|uniref:Uncharacterized protein n=1 Tax=Dryococelus australis TaxID=614101 RepID=A0ABQ9IET7_9NEOP|nr:hypothetical protein PR048_000515 [Dryococelus australis]